MTNKIPRGQTLERQEYMRTYRETHPRDRSAYKSAYDATHADENAAYRSANKERIREGKAAWYQENREEILARVKAYSEENKDAILAYQADYYERNSEVVKARVAAYQAAHPEKKAHLENRRRARKAGNGGSHTLEERLEKFAQLGNICFYCGEAKKLTHDHAIPLSRGGTDDIDNILPACQSCNSKKSALTAEEYITKLNHQL